MRERGKEAILTSAVLPPQQSQTHSFFPSVPSLASLSPTGAALILTLTFQCGLIMTLESHSRAPDIWVLPDPAKLGNITRASAPEQ